MFTQTEILNLAYLKQIENWELEYRRSQDFPSEMNIERERKAWKEVKWLEQMLIESSQSDR